MLRVAGGTLRRSFVRPPTTFVPLARFCTTPDVAQLEKTKAHDLPRHFRMLELAGDGDIEGVLALAHAGVDPNECDYDRRTALHLAASEGHIQLVEELIKMGADVNAVDRWGGTPALDAVRARHLDVAKALVEAGATFDTDRGHELINACAATGNAAWLDYSIQAGANINQPGYKDRTPLHVAAASGNTFVTRLLLENGANPALKDADGKTAKDLARVASQDDCVNVLEHFGEARDYDQLKPIVLNKDVDQSHMDATFKTLLREGTFKDNVVAQEVDWFYNNLRLIPFYFMRFTPAETAAHITSYMAAKRVALNKHSDIYMAEEENETAFYLCSNEVSAQSKVEKQVSAYVNSRIQGNTSFSLNQFTSGGVGLPYGNKKLVLSVLDADEFPADASFDPSEDNIEKVASKNFLKVRPMGSRTRDRYQEIMTECIKRTTPLIKSSDALDDGSTPLVIAQREPAGETFSSLEELTGILDSNNIQCERKIVETFANGVTFTTLYVREDNKAKLKLFMDEVSLLCTLPPSKILTPLFIEGALTGSEYAYATLAKKFVFHFLAPSNFEDFDLLRKSLKGKDHNLSLLMNLRKKMKRDSVSEMRIAECVDGHVDLIKECYADFYARVSPHHEGARPELGAINASISQDIVKRTHDEIDRSILDTFAVFNASVRKTNFYKNRKAAVSVRLEPESFINSAGFDEVPHGIFMVVGPEFTGFHVRFRDVARGGIRLIKSANAAAYSRNVDSVFLENYNLAHTQNFKNKDIPEFGSKGTILLQADRQSDINGPFRKYVSALMDLLIPSNWVVDHVKQPEILFLGPDENTADVMEWAALYAKERGYPFWKAFTTGKPPSLGGIPHDTYGMTTRSVHTNVTEALKRMNLKEEEVTKLQTGGPDGDLGCNEIKISRDRTISIVDGSGVLHDPQGLNREELFRLANERRPIDHFDSSLIGPGGFRVLVNEVGSALPDGRIVESGLTFRNEFHLDPLSSADLFVPCGGRPESVNRQNVNKLFNKDGSCRFKCIVEGANLFFTQEARAVLAGAGVVLFKDATANKGGVTSSSLEVLAALTLNDEEFGESMCVSGSDLPPFYQDYVEEVQQKIEENARLEFECIWRESERTNLPPYILTDQVSDKINQLNVAIDGSGLFNSASLRAEVLRRYIPKSLVEKVGGIEEIERRLPENYLRATFGCYLASRYIYQYGLGANEFAFFENMKQYDTNK